MVALVNEEESYLVVAYNQEGHVICQKEVVTFCQVVVLSLLGVVTFCPLEVVPEPLEVIVCPLVVVDLYQTEVEIEYLVVAFVVHVGRVAI